MTKTVVKKNVKKSNKSTRTPWLEILWKDLNRKWNFIVSINEEILEEIEDMILGRMIEEVQSEDTMTVEEFFKRLAQEYGDKD